MHLSVDELLQYTDEERQAWESWFRDNGEDLLKMPLLGGRENTVGAMILDIFGPEFRYALRLRGEQPGEYRNRPCARIDALFGFGLESRNLMRNYVRKVEPAEWGRLIEVDVAGRIYQASARKIVMHVLLHEIRHWAQLGRVMGERGFVPPGNPDLLFSSALV